MKRIFRTILGAAMLLSVSTMTALAQEPSEGPLWMRYSAISPDGSTIAFAYKGDIFSGRQHHRICLQGRYIYCTRDRRPGPSDHLQRCF